MPILKTLEYMKNKMNKIVAHLKNEFGCSINLTAKPWFLVSSKLGVWRAYIQKNHRKIFP